MFNMNVISNYCKVNCKSNYNYFLAFENLAPLESNPKHKIQTLF